MTFGGKKSSCRFCSLMGLLRSLTEVSGVTVVVGNISPGQVSGSIILLILSGINSVYILLSSRCFPPKK